MTATGGFSVATALAAEGARVGLVSCDCCGAAILLDPRDPRDELEIHNDWHRRMEIGFIRALGGSNR